MLRQIAREARTEAPAVTRSPTPAEMRQLMDDCDAAARRCFETAQSLGLLPGQPKGK
jgi:hypothetical protein